MKHWLTIITVSLFLIVAVTIGVASFRSMTRKTIGNGTVAKTMEGEKIAGAASVYLAFSKDDYQRALDGDKIILLNFYANWCPFCRAEEPVITAWFDNLASDRLVGFRVNYNDSETDVDEKALADQFKIAYQHTKVILKDGKEVFRTGDTWTKEDFAKNINPLLSE